MRFLVAGGIWRFPFWKVSNKDGAYFVRYPMNARKKKLLITAGPTREWLDPVRYISNPSSGKMGYAVAAAAVQAGYDVDLVSGPVQLDAPVGLQFHEVETALEMCYVVEDLFENCDCFISVAAVGDWRPADVHSHKLKKGAERLVLELVPNPDILWAMSTRKREGQIVVGFCAETEELEANARKKLEEKDLDWIAGNYVGKGSRDGGFGSDNNTLLLLGREGQKVTFGPGPKEVLAKELVSRVLS